MDQVKPLAAQFQPLQVKLELSCSSNLIKNVQEELAGKATVDQNKCWGYFPGMSANRTIDARLPKSQKFAKAVPSLNIENKNLKFNFVRLSLTQQKANSPFHLDTDAATALTGEISTISKRLVWRLLINLNDKHPRTLAYLDLDSLSTEISVDRGYLHIKNAPKQTIRQITIPPRRDSMVQGVLFCASRVLHTGQDDKFGHFVTGYGCEEVA